MTIHVSRYYIKTQSRKGRLRCFDVQSFKLEISNTIIFKKLNKLKLFFLNYFYMLGDYLKHNFLVFDSLYLYINSKKLNI